jgi:hypothetical protein
MTAKKLNEFLAKHKLFCFWQKDKLMLIIDTCLLGQFNGKLLKDYCFADGGIDIEFFGGHCSFELNDICEEHYGIDLNDIIAASDKYSQMPWRTEFS